MEKDAYMRFKRDDQAISAAVDAFWVKADVDGDGALTFEEYKRWVYAEPVVLVFLVHLSDSVKSLMGKVDVARRQSMVAAKLPVELLDVDA